jgi:uncharacterized protein Yka (UPF0111/DUF47 family)
MNETEQTEMDLLVNGIIARIDSMIERIDKMNEMIDEIKREMDNRNNKSSIYTKE